MIPRLRPYLNYQELHRALSPLEGGVLEFEAAFAREMGAESALAFPYGRSALWAFFKALNIRNSEVIMPAYTCSVVGHAVVLSENIPRFVDISLNDFNMRLDEVAEAIGPDTRAIIATHLFGYPLDIEHLGAIVSAAEARYGHKIWVIQDCAHSFRAEWRGEPVSAGGDVAIYGLNISKMITSIFGGMLTTRDEAVGRRLRAWRDKHFQQADLLKAGRQFAYLLAVYPAFQPTVYTLLKWLQDHSPLLKPLTDAYHLDEKIHFPPDYRDHMVPLAARVGLVQLEKYASIVAARRENARIYDNHLRQMQEIDWELPPLVDGATYSHYVILVDNRQKWLQQARLRGVELGELIQYSIPELEPYRIYAYRKFDNAAHAMRHSINLPMQPDLTNTDRERVIDVLRQIAAITP